MALVVVQRADRVMDRRAFLGTLSLLAAPLTAMAQAPGRGYRIGVLFESTPPANMVGPEPRSPLLRPFLQALRELGYVEGQNLVVERRSADGQPERLPGLAAELLQLPVELILASGEETTPVLLNATRTIPIVQPTLSDPVERGFITSLARPGGNLTGLTLRPDAAIYGKLLQLLKEAVPRVSRVAVLYRTLPSRRASSTVLEITTAAKRMRVTLVPSAVERGDQFDAAFAAIQRERSDGLVVEANGLTQRYAASIAGFAARTRVPAIAARRSFPEAGGLMSYGPDVVAHFRRAALYAHKILNGAKPAELPVEQPTTLELVINLRTAKVLGVTMPASLLQQADKEIE